MMTETKQCPKCSGAMTQGVLQKTNTFGNSPYVYAPAQSDRGLTLVGSDEYHEGVVHKLFRPLQSVETFVWTQYRQAYVP